MSTELKDLNHRSEPEGFRLTRWHVPAFKPSFQIFLCVWFQASSKCQIIPIVALLSFVAVFSAGSLIKLRTFAHPQFPLNTVTLTKNRNTGGDSPQSFEWGKQSSSWELACKLSGRYKIKPSEKPNESNRKIGILVIMAVTVWFRTANTEKARTRLCSAWIICYLIKPPTLCFTETKSNFWWQICISVFSNQALPVEHSTFAGRKWVKQEREAHLHQPDDKLSCMFYFL